MFKLFQSLFGRRELYFHEDDYCQQQLLPRGTAEFVKGQQQSIEEFASSHRTPGGVGWTEMYMRKDPPTDLCTLKMTLDDIAGVIERYLPPFEIVYTGYSSHREHCKNTAAWGKTSHCALLLNWDSDGIICNIWSEFFDSDDESVSAATKAIGTIGKIQPLIYVDWAWGYVCDASDEATFASSLRNKLNTIESRMSERRLGPDA